MMNFIHNLKYAFKSLLRNKTNLIWTLLFPMGLATFMFVAFANIFETDEIFHTIPIAVVREADNFGFDFLMKGLSGDSEDALFAVQSEEEQEAKELLKNDEIYAIIYVKKDIELVIEKESIQATIIKTVFEEFEKNSTMIQEIAEKDLLAAFRALFSSISMQQKQYYTEMTSSNGVQNQFYCYFYAIFAMSCLFASFAGCEKIANLQANESALGMRRSLSSTSKACVIASEFLSMAVMQFFVELVVLGYMTILGIDFGNRYPAIILTLFFGASIGISLGMIVGSFAKLSKGSRSGICVSVSMVLSVLADLCVGGLKNEIENTFPIINRINPAALIADALYSLNVYDNYDRFTRNIVTLGCMAFVMVVISFLILRRNKYASL